ncbi:threonine/serine exporter family protein [Helicobacter sp. 23-1045]
MHFNKFTKFYTPKAPEFHAKSAEIQALAEFLMDYTLAMLSIGTYTSRVEKCAKRIGQAFGYDVHIAIFSHTINISILAHDNYTKSKTFVRGYSDLALDFNKISALSALSWHAYDDKITFEALKANFERIMRQKRYGFFGNLILSSFAFAAFCRIFGGDFGAVGVIFVSTFIGVLVRHILVKMKIDSRIIFVLCAFVASMIAYFGGVMGLTSKPDVAIGSSVLFLIPGIYLINGVIDILDGHSLNGLSRLIRVTILISCIAVGLYATLSFSKLPMEY